MAEDNQPKRRMDLTEMGTTGLEHHGGHIYEEKLRQLSGMRRNLIFKEMEDNDPIVGAILFAIDKLIRKVDWSVTAADNSPEAKDNAQFLREVQDDMEQPWEDVISEIMSMLPFGFAPIEQVFKVRNGPSLDPEKHSRFSDGMIGWKKLSLRAQETISRWEIADNGTIQGLWQCAPPLYKEVFIPMEKILLFRTTTRKNNPMGKSVLRNAFRPWFFKKKIENIEAIGIERDLAGLPMAMVPPEIMSSDASPAEKAIYDKVKQIVTNIKRDEQEGVIFPMMYDENKNPLYKLELLSTGGSRQFKTNEVINRYDNRIAMTVLADFIVMGHEKVGSFSLASSKTSMFSMALEAWLKMVAAEFDRKAIPLLFQLNGKPLEKLPTISFGDIETIDLKELAAYVTSLTGAGIDLAGENSSRYLKEQGNIPLDEDID